jgi:CheY-like chemotaxis protein
MKDDATIFLIDDDSDDREIFTLALEEVFPFYTCVTAKNGVEALERLRSGDVKPDYIFLDLNMPRMNGKQCLAEIKKEFALGKIPVIIYSTSSEFHHREQMITMGASAFVTKPPVIPELIASLKAVFDTLK